MIFKTPEDIEEVRRLYWDEGLDAKQIADRFLCAPCTVYACMIKNDIPRRERGSGSDPELYDVGGRMMSARQIAEETGATFSTIYRRIERGWRGEKLLRPPLETGRKRHGNMA